MKSKSKGNSTLSLQDAMSSMSLSEEGHRSGGSLDISQALLSIQKKTTTTTTRTPSGGHGHGGQSSSSRWSGGDIEVDQRDKLLPRATPSPSIASSTGRSQKSAGRHVVWGPTDTRSPPRRPRSAGATSRAAPPSGSVRSGGGSVRSRRAHGAATSGATSKWTPQGDSYKRERGVGQEVPSSRGADGERSNALERKTRPNIAQSRQHPRPLQPPPPPSSHVQRAPPRTNSRLASTASTSGPSSKQGHSAFRPGLKTSGSRRPPNSQNYSFNSSASSRSSSSLPRGARPPGDGDSTRGSGRSRPVAESRAATERPHQTQAQDGASRTTGRPPQAVDSASRITGQPIPGPKPQGLGGAPRATATATATARPQPPVAVDGSTRTTKPPTVVSPPQNSSSGRSHAPAAAAAAASRTIAHPPGSGTHDQLRSPEVGTEFFLRNQPVYTSSLLSTPTIESRSETPNSRTTSFDVNSLTETYELLASKSERKKARKELGFILDNLSTSPSDATDAYSDSLMHSREDSTRATIRAFLGGESKRSYRRRMGKTAFSRMVKGTSLWIFLSLCLLLVSNLLYMTAFVTNGWGLLTVHRGNASNSAAAVRRSVRAAAADSAADGPVSSPAPTTSHVPGQPFVPSNDIGSRAASLTGEYWQFGLWQCCRNDGFCLGPRWPAFYSAARAFAVLALFSHVLAFAWMLGHTLEKLLDKDVCTMSSLISCCFLSAIFVFVSVCCFGIRWPSDFRHEYQGTEARLSYSFYMAVCTIPITIAASVFAILDLKGSQAKEAETRKRFYSDSELPPMDEPSEVAAAPPTIQLTDVRGARAASAQADKAHPGTNDLAAALAANR